MTEATNMSSAYRPPVYWLPRLVVAPGFVVSLLFIYGLMVWNGYLSLQPLEFFRITSSLVSNSTRPCGRATVSGLP